MENHEPYDATFLLQTSLRNSNKYEGVWMPGVGVWYVVSLSQLVVLLHHYSEAGVLVKLTSECHTLSSMLLEVLVHKFCALVAEVFAD